MRSVLLLSVMLLVGCGGPRVFVGTFTGPLDSVIGCTDGSGGQSSVVFTYVFSQSGSAVSVDTGTVCHALSGTADGDVASFDTSPCDPHSSGGVSYTQRFAGGTMELGSDGMRVSTTDSLTFSGPSVSGSCSVSTTGTLR